MTRGWRCDSCELIAAHSVLYRKRGPAVGVPAHRAVPQHVEVIDAVRARQHPRNHTARLGHRVRRVHREELTEQVVQDVVIGGSGLR